MRILVINSVCGIRSTGRICTDIVDEYKKMGYECRVAYGREIVPEEYKDIAYRIGSELSIKINGMFARLLDNEGFNAKRATFRFIKWAENYNPDILWIHNLHGYYINIEILFKWIKSRPNMKVKWTLHDCWAFTGHCSHFSYVKCEKWKSKCNNCVQKKEYPRSLWLDRCEANFRKKRDLFCNVNNMTIIVPSNWLMNLVEQSFLKEYCVNVVHNRIDQNLFKPTLSDFRKLNQLEGKIIVLGVASAWSERKGLKDFIELSTQLNESYKIVMVGLTKRQKRNLPKDILCIEHTNSKKELAEIYTAADVFINPSREETFGLTTIEAISCGTIPIVYKDTACEEIVDIYGGIAVEKNVNSICEAIFKLMECNQSEN